VVKHQTLYAHVKTVGESVTLQFASLSINVGADHEDALRFVAHHAEPFRVGDLPGLRPDQQRDLARTLIVSGFLVPPGEAANS
jgi:lysine-specific demethylase/histidyl-hydroxylase NO66